MASEYSSDYEPIDGFIGDESVEMETGDHVAIQLDGDSDDDGDDQTIAMQSTADTTVGVWLFHEVIEVWLHNLYII